MTKQLVTLEAFNASRTNELQKERQAELEKIREKYSNGIECPACQKELCDYVKGYQKDNPFQGYQKVWCTYCDWTGNRVN